MFIIPTVRFIYNDDDLRFFERLLAEVGLHRRYASTMLDLVDGGIRHYLEVAKGDCSFASELFAGEHSNEDCLHTTTENIAKNHRMSKTQARKLATLATEAIANALDALSRTERLVLDAFNEKYQDANDGDAIS